MENDVSGIEGLRVGDHQPRGRLQRGQRRWQLRRLHRHADCAAVKDVAEGLLLGQDQPSPGRGGVDGRYQQRHIIFFQQVAHDPLVRLRQARDGRDGLFQLINVVPPPRADIDLVFLRRRDLRQQVAFVQRHDVGRLPLPENGAERLVLRLHAQRRVHHQHGDIGFRQHLSGAPDAHFAQLALVVQAGGVDNDHRPQRQKLHGLVHRVGGGALDG